MWVNNFLFRSFFSRARSFYVEPKPAAARPPKVPFLLQSNICWMLSCYIILHNYICIKVVLTLKIDFRLRAEQKNCQKWFKLTILKKISFWLFLMCKIILVRHRSSKVLNCWKQILFVKIVLLKLFSFCCWTNSHYHNFSAKRSHFNFEGKRVRI